MEINANNLEMLKEIRALQEWVDQNVPSQEELQETCRTLAAIREHEEWLAKHGTDAAELEEQCRTLASIKQLQDET
jgi:hypothetical protein